MNRHSVQFSVSEPASALANRLAEAVVRALKRALESQQSAVLAVSGGSTPRAFLQVLAQQALPWERVRVTLVDERCVPWTDSRANTKMLRDTLFAPNTQSQRATWVPLTTPEGRPLDAEEVSLGSFDVVVFGMGSDGHTASWFPRGQGLYRLVDPHQPARLAATSAPGAPEPRVTWTMAAFQPWPWAALHIEGAEKVNTFRQAWSGDDVLEMPVRALFSWPLVVFCDRPLFEGEAP